MPRFPRPRVAVDLRPYFGDEERFHSNKELIVLHETVSYNRAGVGDIKSVAAFMDSRQLEIHGILDLDGNSAWCYDPRAVYDHAASGGGNVNTRSIGFELVSEIPLLPSPVRFRTWWARRKQLDLAARWIAHLHFDQGIPVRYSRGDRPGITTHWNVSQTYLGGHGHWDCWPRHEGGHFPLHYVIRRAEQYVRGAKGL